jgi:hypothetical protein
VLHLVGQLLILISDARNHEHKIQSIHIQPVRVFLTFVEYQYSYLRHKLTRSDLRVFRFIPFRSFRVTFMAPLRV